MPDTTDRDTTGSETVTEDGIEIPPTPAGRRLVQIGDVVARPAPGRDERAIVAWVGDTPAKARLVFTHASDGAWTGTAATPDSLRHVAANDDGHWFSVDETWTVIQSPWGHTLTPQADATVQPSHTLTLTQYERDNLLAAITAASGCVGISPLSVLNNGDWLKQVGSKLDPAVPGTPTFDAGNPNDTAESLVAKARAVATNEQG